MLKASVRLSLIALLAVTGCATQTQLLDNKQPSALQTALNRGRFELNCPAATGTIISREVVQPGIQGPFVNGIQRAEFTVGIEGCGERKTYVVICPEGGEGCFASGPGNFIWRQ